MTRARIGGARIGSLRVGSLRVGGAVRSACAFAVSVTVCLSAGVAESGVLPFEGTLRFQGVAGAAVVLSGSGAASVTTDGNFHLLSFGLGAGVFGPVTTGVWNTLPGTPPHLQVSDFANEAGAFSGISGGSPGGGTMGVRGLARLCVFNLETCNVLQIPLPVAASGGAGFGIGGTQTASAGGISVTAQHAPWTLGQPAITLHDAGTTVGTPAWALVPAAPGTPLPIMTTHGTYSAVRSWVRPAGFAHGPGSATSSTARPSGVLQLVTVTRVFTSLSTAAEFVNIGVLRIQFIPEPVTATLLGAGALALALFARLREREGAADRTDRPM